MPPTLATRKIGGTDVSAIGYGAMGIAAFYGTVENDEERFKILDAVYESGCTLWDTADVYNDSEELLGKWFKRTGKRSEIFLATKFAFTPWDKSRPVNGDPAYVKSAFEKSLGRLGVDHVDLYYMHRPDPTVPIETTVRAMVELVHAGKVRHLGLSEISAATLRRAHAVHPIAAIQVEYSPFTLDIEDPAIDLLRTARELGVAVVAYSPLGRGLLTGQYKSPDDFEDGDFRRGVPRFSRENFPHILTLADGLKQVGAAHGATAGQVALAWLLAQGPDVIPIPGTRKLKYLHENMGALDVKLSEADVKKVRALVEEADNAGGLAADRYPPGHMELLFQDTPALD